MSIESGPSNQDEAGPSQPEGEFPEMVSEEKARIGAGAEKTLRDAAREEGVTPEEKKVLDRVAEKRGEKAMQEVFSEAEIDKRYKERMGKLKKLEEKIAKDHGKVFHSYTRGPGGESVELSLLDAEKGSARYRKFRSEAYNDHGTRVPQMTELEKLASALAQKEDEIEEQARKSREKLKNQEKKTAGEEISGI